jgi:hypothetical protein
MAALGDDIDVVPLLQDRIFPQLQVKHLKKWTLINWVRTDLFRRGIPWVRLMRATRDWTSQLNFSWSQRAASFAAAMLVACIPFIANRAFVFTGMLAFAVFLVLNLRFINLVRRKRVLLASIGVVPLHILYSLICVTSVVAAFLYPPLRLPASLPLIADDSTKVASEICSKG